MLDKLKLFNKEKQQNAVNAASVASKTQIQSKRTSSSSGFSSARSERSDSSLSLNDGHGSQLKPPSISVSSQKPQPKTKQSKLLAAQQKKEQANKATKLDKKEKSPARSLNKEESGNESRSSTMGRTGKSSLVRAVGGVEKNTPKTSSKSSLHSKSDSKSSLKAPQLLQSPSSGGLPKPIAAIKGTSKLPSLGGGAGHLPAAESQQNQQLLKRETSDISSNISQPPPAEPPISTHAHIHQNQTPPPPYYANSQPTRHISSHGFLSEPSTPQHSSGIYGSSRLPPPKSALSAPRKLEYNAGPHILSSPTHHQRQGLPRPLVNSAPNTPTASPNKFHTIPSKIVGTIYESKEEQLPPAPPPASGGSSILPMRPLLRGYNSHVTLPTRGARGGHHPHQSYLDFCESDIGQGYCSDGDALRVGSSPGGSRFHDIDNGYLSEGSSGLNGPSSSAGGISPGKHFLSMMRARTQLPTTIEER